MKPKTVIVPKSVSTSNIQNEEKIILGAQQTDLEKKVDDHINDQNVHLDSDTKDGINNLKKKVDDHIDDQNIHVTQNEKDKWSAKETPEGAQSKVNKVLSSLDNHKSDYSIHINKAEKDLLKDKYTKAETRNLLKHSLTSLVFLQAVNSRVELPNKYPNPEFNSCVYIRNEKITLIYNGTNWIDFNGLFSPDITQENDGFMTNIEKIKLDNIEENANNYIHPDNVDTRHVTDAQISTWNAKAENTLVSNISDGLMISSDKKKLDGIEEYANKYVHPNFHNATMITEDTTHRFVTDVEKTTWNSKADVSYVNKSNKDTLSASKSFTDSKIAAMFNSTESQLQILRSLAFELKKDDVVKQFFDLFNNCAKNKELQDHTLNSNIHMNQSDRILLTDVKEALTSGLNPDWKENNPSSVKYIENKPTTLPANGGNSDTVGGYTAEELLSNKSFYDYTIGTSNYTSDEVSILANDDSIVDTVEEVINLINKGKGYSVLFRPGSYLVEKELIIKASNTTFTGIGNISKLLGASIKIIGNNNIIENMTLSNSDDNIVNNIALYIEGNDNIIRFNTIMNYNEGIIVEGSNNIINNNTLVNIRNSTIKILSNINANYGNIIDSNIVKNSNIGINLLSSKNSLTKNHIIKNRILNCSIGIVLSNTVNDITKTTLNIINENIIIRGRGEPSEYLQNHKTISSEFSSKNIISSNITSGKQIIAPNDVLSNNLC